MAITCIDIFNHVMPLPYLDAVKQHANDPGIVTGNHRGADRERLGGTDDHSRQPQTRPSDCALRTPDYPNAGFPSSRDQRAKA